MPSAHTPVSPVPASQCAAGRLATLVVLAAASTLALDTPAAPNTPLPALRELTPTEHSAVLGLPKLSTTELKLKVAAVTRASAFDKGTPRLAVQRKAGTDAAVYSGLPVTTATLLPAGNPTTQLADFMTVGDLVQTWATMTAAGVPHLFAWGYGDFNAEATATWHTTLTVPTGSGMREVYLRFGVPPLTVTGDTETGGAHPWRARVRADLLVNGFPAWSTEATRLRSTRAGGGASNENIILVQFGRALAFAANDEDANPDNNSNHPTYRNAPSTARPVHLTLGRHAEGTQLNLAWVVRGTVWSEPSVVGGTSNRCNWDYTLDRFFCSRASLKITGSAADAPEVRYGP